MVRLHHYLKHGLQTLVEYPGPMTILELRPLYMQKDFRQRVLAKIENPELLEFWKNEWDRLQERQQFDFIMSLLDRLSSISLDRRMRHTLGQSKSTIDFIEIQDEGQLLIVDLDMGKLGEYNSRLLGTLLISKIFQTSMSRKRKDRLFRLYIDEGQNFVSETYAKILSQSRKFGLSQLLCLQYLEQMPPEVLSAVLGNVGTYYGMRAGANDAEIVANIFAHRLTPEELDKTKDDLLNLDPYHVLVKTSVHKYAMPSFKIQTLPMLNNDNAKRKGELLKAAEKMAKHRDAIEKEITIRRGYEEKIYASAQVDNNGRKEPNNGNGNGSNKGNKVYVGKLVPSITKEDLVSLFSPFGEVTEAKIIIDKKTKQQKDFGFVEMITEDAAKKAIVELNGKEIKGTTITVKEAGKPDETSKSSPNGNGNGAREDEAKVDKTFVDVCSDIKEEEKPSPKKTKREDDFV
jgi:hypothetical protein